MTTFKKMTAFVLLVLVCLSACADGRQQVLGPSIAPAANSRMQSGVMQFCPTNDCVAGKATPTQSAAGQDTVANSNGNITSLEVYTGTSRVGPDRLTPSVPYQLHYQPYTRYNYGRPW